MRKEEEEEKTGRAGGLVVYACTIIKQGIGDECISRQEEEEEEKMRRRKRGRESQGQGYIDLCRKKSLGLILD